MRVLKYLPNALLNRLFCKFLFVTEIHQINEYALKFIEKSVI